jgi:hypothetical protein
MSIIEVAINKRRQLLRGKTFSEDQARWKSFWNYCQKHRLSVRFIDWLHQVAR